MLQFDSDSLWFLRTRSFRIIPLERSWTQDPTIQSSTSFLALVHHGPWGQGQRGLAVKTTRQLVALLKLTWPICFPTTQTVLHLPTYQWKATSNQFQVKCNEVPCWCCYCSARTSPVWYGFAMQSAHGAIKAHGEPFRLCKSTASHLCSVRMATNVSNVHHGIMTSQELKGGSRLTCSLSGWFLGVTVPDLGVLAIAWLRIIFFRGSIDSIPVLVLPQHSQGPVEVSRQEVPSPAAHTTPRMAWVFHRYVRSRCFTRLCLPSAPLICVENSPAVGVQMFFFYVAIRGILEPDGFSDAKCVNCFPGWRESGLQIYIYIYITAVVFNLEMFLYVQNFPVCRPFLTQFLTNNHDFPLVRNKISEANGAQKNTLSTTLFAFQNWGASVAQFWRPIFERNHAPLFGTHLPPPPPPPIPPNPYLHSFFRLIRLRSATPQNDFTSSSPAEEKSKKIKIEMTVDHVGSHRPSSETPIKVSGLFWDT